MAKKNEGTNGVAAPVECGLPEWIKAAGAELGISELACTNGDLRTTQAGKKQKIKPTPAPYKEDQGKFFSMPWHADYEFGMTAPGEHGSMAYGPRGTGKTRVAHEMADKHKTRLITMQAARGCTMDDLVGYQCLVDGKHGSVSGFVYGPLPEALMNDCWLHIEEANTMHPTVFSKLNTLLDGSGDALALPDGTRISAGPNFRLSLAFNEGYSGTTEINQALKDRLCPVYTSYPEPATEIKILIDRTGCDEEVAKKLVALAKRIRASQEDINFDLSPRALLRTIGYVKHTGKQWMKACEVAILNLVGDPIIKKAERNTILEIIKLEKPESWPAPKFS